MRNAALIALLVTVLAVLAVLQYRWIGDVSAAEEHRARVAMDGAARRFNEEIERELNRTITLFQRAQRDAYEIELLRQEWEDAARDPRLIAHIWVIEEQLDDYPSLLSVENGELVAVKDVPKQLLPLMVTRAMTDPEGRPGPARRPFVGDVPALIVPIRPHAMIRERLFEGGFSPMGGGPPRHRTFVVLELNRAYITGELFPTLAREFFGEEYAVAVSDGRSIVYRSDPKWPADGSRPDAELPLFRLRISRPPGARGPMMDDVPPPSDWKLLVRRAEMPLAHAIAATRRRNLQISLAILALLGGTVALLGVAARRAERLRRQQLEFVAGITHELNTPLAALRAAGQNLADGIVADGEQTRRYGSMIAKESSRLSETVAQVLDYAGMQGRTAPMRLAPVDVAAVIEDALGATRWLATDRGIEIETDVPKELPPLDGDAMALTSAVKNLIVNAIRHGGEGGWIRVSAVAEGKHLCIRIEDRGPGIAPHDLPHLFDAFYRGRGAEQVRGSGLGLAIVSQVAKAHGGSVEAERRRPRGAAFILRLPLRESVSPAMERQHV